MTTSRTQLLRALAVLASMACANGAHAESMFTHQIAFKLPRGAGGMQPNLALVYEPGAGNGIVGVGWQLTGLSSVTRVNYEAGVAFKGSDTYAHSRLGVLVAQADRSYRSKKEQFVKLTTSGTCGDGPCSWVAYDRSGTAFSYGTTADARLLKQGSASVYTWALAKVMDVFGNSYDVTYTNDAANGQLYPTTITYTKGSGLVGPFRTVGFAYEARTDVEQGYSPGGFRQTTNRLKMVTIQSGGVNVAQYRLDYEEYGALTGRSHLTRVQELGSDGTSFPVAQTFGWQQGTESDSAAPDLLTRVENGLGGRVDVSYAPAPQVLNAIVPTSTAPGIPLTLPQQLVTRTSKLDGRGGSYSTRYNYYDARILLGTIPNVRNLGFGYVESIDDQTLQSTRSYFHQTPGREGHASEVVSFAARGQVVSRTLPVYDLVNPNPGTELVRETSRVVTSFELGTLAFSSSMSFAYDAYGNVVAVTDASDGQPTVTTTTTYADGGANLVSWILGRIAEVRTTSGGVTLTDTVNTWNNNTITAKSAWLDSTRSWVTTLMSYDGANGNLLSVTEPATPDAIVRKTITEFDATFRAYPVKVTNALGQITRYTYNANGSVTSVTDPNGQVTNTEYDVFGRKVKETRPGGEATLWAYVGYGNPGAQYDETVTPVDASRVLFKRSFFDGMGFTYLVASSGDCGTAGTIVQGRSYQYVASETQKDYAGRPYRQSLPYCGGGSAVWTTTAYDDAGRPQYAQTPDGKSHVYTYGTNWRAEADSNGQITKKYFDARNRVVAVEDPAGNRTSYSYDPAGRLASVTLPGGAVTAVAYDTLGRKVSIVEPNLSTIYGYDDAGNLTTVTTGGKTVTMQYDAHNRVTRKNPAAEPAVTYVYDEPSVANGIGRLTTLSDASGSSSFSYDPVGRSAVAAKWIGSTSFTTQQQYDVGGRLTRLAYPDGSYVTYAYGDGGNLSTVTLNGALVATWSGYDARGQPGTAVYANGVASTFRYDDALGHLTSLVTSSGAAKLQDLTYDWYSAPNTGGLNVGSIVDNRETKVVLGCNTDETQSYTYDGLGRLTKATGVWGTKTYAYDAIGNPTTFAGLVDRTLVFVGQQVVSGTGISAVTYDAAGNMIHKVEDGVAWDYTWTAEGRLSTAARNALQTAQMIYDADGSRVTKTFTPAVGPAITTTYIGQLYEKRSFSDGSPEQHTINLFAHGQLIASVTKSGSIVTAADSSTGWRSHLALGALYDGASLAGAAHKALEYARALSAHPMSRRWPATGILVLGALALVMVFTRALARRAFAPTIPPWMRLASLGIVIVFGFTGCGGGPNPGGDLGTRRNGLLSGDTISGLPTGTHYYHRNHVNSSTVVTDVNGGEAMRAVYLPFGEVSQPNSAGRDVSTSKFTGKELDEETGLYYYGARYYDPSIGRFVSADTVVPAVTDAQAFNRYSYVRNNPIVYTDPTGHSFWDSKRFRVISTAALFAAAIVGTCIAPEIFAPVLIGMALGAASGGYAAWHANGGGSLDWDSFSKGLLFGAVVGGAAGFATGPLGLGALPWGHGLGWSIAEGATIGAVNGAAMGAASGYQGGATGWQAGFWTMVAIGALAGAAAGGILGGLQYTMGQAWPETFNPDVSKVEVTGAEKPVPPTAFAHPESVPPPGTAPGVQPNASGVNWTKLGGGVFQGLAKGATEFAQTAGRAALLSDVFTSAVAMGASGAVIVWTQEQFDFGPYTVYSGRW